MNATKPARKDFGLARKEGPDWEVRPIAESAAKNGSSWIGKDVQSLFAASGFALTPKLGGNDEIRQPYLESWVVHCCLRVIAEAIEQVAFGIWDGPSETATKLGDDHPVVRLFQRPNPWTSWSQLASMGSIHRNLSGEDLWFLADANGDPIVQGDAAYDPMIPIPLPASINSVNGTYVGDERNANGRVVNWTYGSAKGERKFPVGSVIHFYNYDPTDPCRGVGPVEVAMRQLSIAFQAERYGEATLRAGGPGAFIVYENEMGPEMQRGFQEDVDNASKDPRSVGRMKVLTGKAKVYPIPQSPKDMLSVDTLKWSRDVVAGLLGVPLPIIGVFERATYSNMKEAWRQFWLRIRAYLVTVEDVINTSFFQRMRDPAFRRLRFGFDLTNVRALKGDEAELIKLAMELVARGIGLTLNDALDLVGVESEHVPGGDVRLFNAQMQTAPSPPRSATPAPGNNPNPLDSPTASKLLELLKEEIAKQWNS